MAINANWQIQVVFLIICVDIIVYVNFLDMLCFDTYVKINGVKRNVKMVLKAVIEFIVLCYLGRIPGITEDNGIICVNRIILITLKNMFR